MKKFIIEESFWKIFPEAKIGVVLCNDINNQIKDAGEPHHPNKYLDGASFSRLRIHCISIVLA